MADSSQATRDDLETLARARFPALNEAELKLLRAAPQGKVPVCGPNADPSDPANDPANADNWGSEREIRADLIRWLSVDAEAAKNVDPRGIRVYAAKVTGKLDLSFATLRFPLLLHCCFLTDDADLTSVQIPALSLSGSRAQSITADGARVASSVFLNDKFTAEGAVRLLGAQIGGQLDCSGGTFKNPPKLGQDGKVLEATGTALFADRARVKGNVFLSDKFTAEGEVRLLGAQIGGQLACSGGTFKNPGGNALSADGAKVTGDVFLSEKFTAEGEVRLPGAQIGGNLDCSDGTFKNPGGKALSADGAHVTGSVFVSVRQIREDGRDVILPFTAEGEVRLPGAQIDHDLDCSGGTFSALIAQTAVIKGNFFWRGVKNPAGATLDLTNASAGAIADGQASWPSKGKLRLDGFTYDRISEGPTDAKTRLEWLDRVDDDEFTLQPFQQLAKVLRESGDVRGARQVLFEMERRRRKEQRRKIKGLLAPPRRWLASAWSGLLELTIGYGQMPWLALGWLAALWLLGFGFSGLGYLGGAMAPSQKEAYDIFESQGQPPRYYPHFCAPIYSLEHSFPFVNLGQKDSWAPNPEGVGRVPKHQSSCLEPLFRRYLLLSQAFRLDNPTFLRVWFWFQIAAGWVLATLFVAGLTGIVRSG